MKNNNEPKGTKEQRLSKRITPTQKVTIENTLTGETLGTVSNINETGFMIYGKNTLEEEGVYQLQLVLSQAVEGRFHVVFGGECLWTKQGDGGEQWAGIQIIDIAEDDALCLKNIVREF